MANAGQWFTISNEWVGTTFIIYHRSALWVLSFLSPKTSDDQYTCDFQKRDYSRYSFCVFVYSWHNKHWINSWREDFVNGTELPPENWAGVMIRTLKTLAFTLILKSGFGVCTSHLIWGSSLFQGDWLCTQQLKSVKMNQLTQLPMTAKIAWMPFTVTFSSKSLKLGEL